MWFKINTGRQAPGEPWVDHNIYTAQPEGEVKDPVSALCGLLTEIIEREGGTLPKEIFIEVGEGDPPSIEDWFDEAMKNDYLGGMN